MNEKTKFYQLTCIFSPLAGQSESEAMTRETEKWIADQGGNMLRSSKVERKTLSYPIKKFLEAFYWTADFSLPPENVQQLKQNLRLNTSIIRDLFVIGTEAKTVKVVAIPVQPEPLSNAIIDKVEPIDTMPPEITKEEENADKKIDNNTNKKEAQEEPRKKTKAASRPTEIRKTVKNEKAQIEDLDKELEKILNQ